MKKINNLSKFFTEEHIKVIKNTLKQLDIEPTVIYPDEGVFCINYRFKDVELRCKLGIDVLYMYVVGRNHKVAFDEFIHNYRIYRNCGFAQKINNAIMMIHLYQTLSENSKKKLIAKWEAGYYEFEQSYRNESFI